LNYWVFQVRKLFFVLSESTLIFLRVGQMIAWTKAPVVIVFVLSPVIIPGKL